MERIGIIGAGAMGRGIAKNFKKSGYDVVAHKRQIDESNDSVIYLRNHEIVITDDLDYLFSRSDVLLTCLPDSPTVEQILLGPKGLANSSDCMVRCVLDFTTALPESTQKIAKKLKSIGIDMLDTPMTGGPKQADEGTINLIVGGDEEVLGRYRGLLEQVSEKIVYAGPSGNGNAIKLVNNFLSILNRAASPGVAILMQQMGVSLEPVFDFISASGGNSKGFNTMMKRIMQDDSSVGFALDLAYKDLRYNKELFKSVGGFPILDALVDAYKEADENGYANQDVSAIFFSLANRMGNNKD